MKQHYSPEEADAIIGRAVKGLPLPGDLTREQLLKTAAEVGVTPEQLEAAEAEYRRTADIQEFWASYRTYRLRKLLSLLPAMMGVFLIFGLRAARDMNGLAISLIALTMLAAIGVAFAKTASCSGSSMLGQRKLRRFIEMRKRMGLPVPPNLTSRDY